MEFAMEGLYAMYTWGRVAYNGEKNDEFIAKTTLQEKVWSAFNLMILGAFLYNLYNFRAAKSGYTASIVNALVVRKIVGTAISTFVYQKALKETKERVSEFSAWSTSDLSHFTIGPDSPYNEFEETNNDSSSAPQAPPGGISTLNQKLENAKDDFARLEILGYTIERRTLHKSGVPYEAVCISHPNATAGRWSIHARGNMQTLEDGMCDTVRENLKWLKCNTILINGPSVGKSRSWVTGWVTRYSCGAAFEAGLQYLEQKKGAERINMEGFSLGGGMMGEAVLQHDFETGMKSGKRYHSVSDRTFDQQSHIAGEMVGGGIESLAEQVRIIPVRNAGILLGKIIKIAVSGICMLTGAELDGIAAARKLEGLNIKHVILQHWSKQSPNDDDGIIPDQTSLYNSLTKSSERHQFKEGTHCFEKAGTKQQVFILSDELSHNDHLDEATVKICPKKKPIRSALIQEKVAFFNAQ
jgi:hypothetical protein